MNHTPLVKIIPGDGEGSVRGTQVTIDGVEQPPFVELSIEMKVKDIARLTIKRYARVEFEGHADVNIVHVCPECRNDLVQAAGPDKVALVDTTTSVDSWVRRQPVGPPEPRPVLKSDLDIFAE